MTPFGDIVAVEQRGLFLGNRGSIHRDRTIVRPWQVRRWITCALEYKGWVAPKWQPGRWTPLFFLDEAVALAAGHRPCSLCRHADFVRWLDGWEAATGDRPKVDPMDRVLHDERVDDRRAKRTHRRPWASLPDGTFVVVGDDAGVAAVVVGDALVPWTPLPSGYDRAATQRRPTRGDATILTPPSSVAVLQAGYQPALHPSVRGFGS